MFEKENCEYTTFVTIFFVMISSVLSGKFIIIIFASIEKIWKFYRKYSRVGWMLKKLSESPTKK